MRMPSPSQAAIDGYRFRLHSVSEGGQAVLPILRACEPVHINRGTLALEAPSRTSGTRSGLTSKLPSGHIRLGF
jgi:hypothetical protein